MKRRLRYKGPNGDINRDEDLGHGIVWRSSVEARNPVALADAVPPKREHLKYVNQDTAAKHLPEKNPTFRGRI